MTWHTENSFHERMDLRCRLNQVPQPFAVFYHVACMGNWREVFAEQEAVFSALSLRPRAAVLGSEEDREYVSRFMSVIYHDSDLHEYETPTLEALWGWCQEHPAGAVLYCHTKGVSNPADRSKRAWRRLMERHVIGDWRHNLNKLAIFDMVGVDWQHGNMPHYSGNFWMARADWINHLPSPVEYRDAGGPVIWGNPWARMAAEMWIGCRPWHSMSSLVCENTNLAVLETAENLLKLPSL